MKPEDLEGPELSVQVLARTRVFTLADVCCRGSCRHGPEECATNTQLVFPYRGAFARQVGTRETIAEANQVVFFNGGEDYRVNHPTSGGDACLSLTLHEDFLGELAPPDLFKPGPGYRFVPPRLGLTSRLQVNAARLRRRLGRMAPDSLAAEEAVVSFIADLFGPRSRRGLGGSLGTQRLADRVKRILVSDLGRRWSLAEIAAEAGVSPVYLTQVFKSVEGAPLYRYQRALRLARALDEAPATEDLTALALDLGFSSHSHFTTAFRQAYGITPSTYRRQMRSGASG